ncbi:MAG: DinB family protein [Syntrophobacteraceae bacterium]
MMFVRNCTEDDWRKTGSEEWPVGVTARHIGANHYTVIPVARMILKGEKFPERTREQITENANRHAREHADCTKSEVLDILQDRGQKIVEFTRDLEDSDLDKTGFLPALGSRISLEQFLENVILKSAEAHFLSMQEATGRQ